MKNENNKIVCELISFENVYYQTNNTIIKYYFFFLFQIPDQIEDQQNIDEQQPLNQKNQEQTAENNIEKSKQVNKKILWILISFTFLSSTFGGGLLALPSIAVKMGFIPYLIMNLAVVAFTCFVFKYIVEMQYRNQCEVPTLTNLISKYYGKVWLFFMDLAIIFCLMPISYISISSDYIRTFLIDVCHLDELASNDWQVGMKFVTTLCVMYPLTFIKTIKVLNYVSSLCIVFVFATVLYVIVKFFIWLATGKLNGVEHPHPKFPLLPASADMVPDVLTYICMFFSLYSIHASIVCVMYEYHKDFHLDSKFVKEQVTKSIYYITLPIAFIVYILFGLIGMLMFNQTCDDNDETCILPNSNVLLTFTNDVVANVIELLFSVVVFICFPCMLYPIRKSVMTFMHCNDLDLNKKGDYAIYNIIGFCITVICLIIATCLSSLDQIQSFSANLLGIILYGVSGMLLWYASSKDKSKVVFWIGVVILIVLNVVGLSCQIYTWVR